MVAFEELFLQDQCRKKYIKKYFLIIVFHIPSVILRFYVYEFI